MSSENRITEYSKLIPEELKDIVTYAPKDDIDWALVIYLACHRQKGNIITLGKISTYFNIKKLVLIERLNNMLYWVNLSVCYGYEKPFYTVEITGMGYDFLSKMTEMLENWLK